ncbi:formate transporter FocA [Brachybacterium paraconglomeratum]|uniref:formate transporter FocA n=1 Tax=Brachybacterium paraconglomeratum TaxID=173362 RepID=UPI0031F01829
MNTHEPTDTAAPSAPPAASAAPSLVITAPKPLTKALEDAMYAKATAPWSQMFLQTLTGGAFIALGFVFMVTTQQGMGDWPIGIAKLIGGTVFSVGLGLVVISGSDLFTGTTLTLMPRLSGRISTGRMLGHWGMSAGGNLIGALLIALLMLGAGTHATNGSAWGLIVLDTTQAKLGHDWHQAFFLGILANLAVCLAVWVATAGKTVTDKVLGVAGPIALFVATGFEHSVANMFMLPMGLLIKNFAGDSFWQGEAIQAAGKSLEDYSSLTIGAALWDNLIPVLLGNIVGGAVLVGAYFWATYRRGDDDLAKS